MPKHVFDMLPRESSMLVIFALVILSGYSSYISVEGVLLLAEVATHTLAGKLKVFLLGIAMWSMFYLLWDLCLRIIPKLGRQRILGTIMMLVLVVPLVLGGSTVFGATGFAGSAPQAFHLLLQIDAFDRTLQKLLRSVGRLKAALPIVDASAEHYGREARRELKKGHYTGVPGPGAVSSTLEAIETELGAVAVSIRQVSTGAPALGEAISKHIANMRAIVDQDAPIRERERAVAHEANQARSLMVRLDTSGTITAISQALASLENAASDQAVSSRSAKLAAAQRKALLQLASEMRTTSKKLGGFLKAIDDGEEAILPVITRMTPTKAIVVYREEFAPIWAAAIGLDFTVLVVVLFLSLAQYRKEQQKEAPLDFGVISVGEIIRNKEALKALAEGGLGIEPPKRGPGRPRKPRATKKA